MNVFFKNSSFYKHLYWNYKASNVWKQLVCSVIFFESWYFCLRKNCILKLPLFTLCNWVSFISQIIFLIWYFGGEGRRLNYILWKSIKYLPLIHFQIVSRKHYEIICPKSSRKFWSIKQWEHVDKTGNVSQCCVAFRFY